MSTHTIERMEAEVDGAGDTVILIHGLGGSSNTFCPQMAVLGRHRAIRPDLPGSGRTRLGAQKLSIELFADHIVALARVLNVGRAILVGHSMGTIVCQHVAAQSPELAAGLVMFGPISEPPSSARDAFRERAKRARAEGMQGIADAIVGSGLSAETRQKRLAAVAFVRESLMRQDPEGYASTCEALAEARAVDPGRIACPVLLVTGEEDQVAPPSAVNMMRERFRRAGATVLGKCGHWTTVEKPDECNASLREFLTKNRP
ncbi:MAG: alpha/beta fold hydrolase [Hyphomicrobiales bacterium]